MKHIALLLWLLCLPVAAWPSPPDALLRDVVQGHVLPRFEALAQTTAELERVAQDTCDPEDASLRAAYGAAFDAWIAVSHLRFGPAETGGRAFALAFWPDTRGSTPKALAGLIADADPVARDAQSYAQVSIAARGFYALEFLLYDDATQALGQAEYRCTLMRTVTADIARISRAILADWQDGYAEAMIDPSQRGPYRSPEEAVQELYKALVTGLQFTSDVRLGRPLGSFERPRPKRAEAWRADRSARHVALSLDSLRDLAARLAGDNTALAARLDDAFAQAQDKLAALDDPAFAGVATPQGRIRIEAVQLLIDRIRDLVGSDLGPDLGVAAGFNALDGD